MAFIVYANRELIFRNKLGFLSMYYDPPFNYYFQSCDAGSIRRFAVCVSDLFLPRTLEDRDAPEKSYDGCSAGFRLRYLFVFFTPPVFKFVVRTRFSWRMY